QMYGGYYPGYGEYPDGRAPYPPGQYPPGDPRAQPYYHVCNALISMKPRLPCLLSDDRWHTPPPNVHSRQTTYSCFDLRTVPTEAEESLGMADMKDRTQPTGIQTTSTENPSRTDPAPEPV
ncbi:unnamed protein product, partial [Lampetra planeri]